MRLSFHQKTTLLGAIEPNGEIKAVRREKLAAWEERKEDLMCMTENHERRANMAGYVDVYANSPIDIVMCDEEPYK